MLSPITHSLPDTYSRTIPSLTRVLKDTTTRAMRNLRAITIKM